MFVSRPRLLWFICFLYLVRFVYICYACKKSFITLSTSAFPEPTLSVLSVSTSMSIFVSTSTLSTLFMSFVASLLYLCLVYAFYDFSAVCVLTAFSASTIPVLDHSSLRLRLLCLCLHCLLRLRLRLCVYVRLRLHLRLCLCLHLLFIVNLNQVYLCQIKS